MRAPIVLCVAALAGALLHASCGYEAGLRVAERYHSVGVEFFGNDSFERDLERPLHDEITRAVRDLVDAPLESPARAEVVIRGTIKDYRRRGGVRSEDNQLLETAVYIEIEAVLVDRRSGRALGPPRAVGKPIGFVLDDPNNEAAARARGLRYIADQLVLDLFAPVD